MRLTECTCSQACSMLLAHGYHMHTPMAMCDCQPAMECHYGQNTSYLTTSAWCSHHNLMFRLNHRHWQGYELGGFVNINIPLIQTNLHRIDPTHTLIKKQGQFEALYTHCQCTEMKANYCTILTKKNTPKILLKFTYATF